jgi:hypothetical protein
MYPDVAAVPRVKMIVDAAEPVACRVAALRLVGACQTDWQAAIDDPAIEAVDICVINRLHEPIAATISDDDIPNATFHDGLQVVRVTAAALESGRSGRWVDL